METQKRNDFTAPVLLIDALQIPLGHRLFDQVVSRFETGCYKAEVDAEKALSLVDFSALKKARLAYFMSIAFEFEKAITEAKELGLNDESERKPLSPEMKEYLSKIDFSKFKMSDYNDW